MTTDGDFALRETYRLGAEAGSDRSSCPSSDDLASMLKKSSVKAITEE